MDERGQIHGERQGVGAVGGVGIKVSGIRTAQAFFGEVVALAAADLGVEDGEQSTDQMRILVHPEHDFVLGEQPVELAPDFAAIDLLRTLLLGQRAQRFKASQKGGHMRVMAVGRVVHVNKLRLRHLEDAEDVSGDIFVTGMLHLFAGIAELDHDALFTHESGFALLLLPHILHLLIGVTGIRSFARTAGTVGNDDTTEPLVLITEAVGDPMESRDFKVVLMAHDSQVGDACEGLCGIALVRDEEVGFGVSE